jgi:hypothetical protein
MRPNVRAMSECDMRLTAIETVPEQNTDSGACHIRIRYLGLHSSKHSMLASGRIRSLDVLILRTITSLGEKAGYRNRMRTSLLPCVGCRHLSILIDKYYTHRLVLHPFCSPKARTSRCFYRGCRIAGPRAPIISRYIDGHQCRLTAFGKRMDDAIYPILYRLQPRRLTSHEQVSRYIRSGRAVCI